MVDKNKMPLAVKLAFDPRLILNPGKMITFD